VIQLPEAIANHAEIASLEKVEIENQEKDKNG
jgi:hypothetical protein